MKLFYFGSVCANEVFNRTVELSKVKPSASAQNFEQALLKGFSGCNNIESTVVSAESIAAYPRGNRLLLRKRLDKITDQCYSQILPAVNLPGLKQWCHARGANKELKRWLKTNQGEDEKCVLVYGLYPQVVKKLQKTCKKYSCRIYSVITDVPSTMFTYTKNKGILKHLFSGSYRNAAISLQNYFDGYIYLTEAMADEVAPGKPYVVIETIADTTIFDEVHANLKEDPPALMYAGALYQKYGVDMLLDVFEQIRSESQLWLFGSGDYEEEIKKRAAKNPRIKFFGRVSREEVLEREIKASLLLNIRNAEDTYTKYSFPSKMIEYMLSGTPVFTTKLLGIPDEYDQYCYMTQERNPESLAEKLDTILAGGAEQMAELGHRASMFVKEQKNCYVQAEKIRAFLQEQIGKDQ